MFCNQCGKKLSMDSKFCSSCGSDTTISIASESSSPPNDKLSNSKLAATTSVSESVRPWVRFWARMFDIVLFSIPAGIVIYMMFPELLYEPGSGQLVNLVALFMWVLVEPFLLATFNTTPGKWLFKITITPTQSNGFTYGTAFQRSIKVWFFGMGAGMPIITLITMLVALLKLNKNGITSWDAEENIKVSHGKIGSLRVIVAVLFFTFIYFTSIILNLM